jgi:putative ABC transport system permease protein
VNAPRRTPVVREIVGVARQVKQRPDEAEDLVQVYQPMTQGGLDDIYLLVRPASGRAAALAPVVRAAIGRVDTAQLVSLGPPRTLEDVAHEATSAHRFRATLVLAFAGLALVLAMAGVFGILAYAVQQRGRDFAVRRALGATTGDVVRIVVRNAARVVVTGAVAGGLASLVLTRTMASVLFGVAPIDPPTLFVVAALLGLAALAAIAGPAWRATRIDPATVLRGQ